ncbi:MAG: hypothetical protein ACWGSQ_00265 [Longimicrobiales bacterium]
MILGLPWTSWLLLFLAVGIGFGISLTFYLAHRGEAGGKGHGADTRDGSTDGAGADSADSRGRSQAPGPPSGRG